MNSLSVNTSHPLWMQTLTRVNEVVTDNVAKIGGVIIIAVMVLICTDIVLTQGFLRPITGVDTIVGYVVVAGAYLQMPNALRKGRFVYAELFIDPLFTKDPSSGAMLRAVYCVIGILVFLLIADGAWNEFSRAYPDKTFGIPGKFTMLQWPLRAIVAAGSVLVAFGYLLKLIENIFVILHHRFSAKMIKWAVICVVYGALFVLIAQLDLSRPMLGLISLFFMVSFVMFGMPIAPALITIGFLFTVIMMPRPTVAYNIVKITTNEFARNYTFGVLPLFVLMGMLVNESGLGKDTFEVARWLTRRVKGGLGVATVVANAIFAAITGSSIASATVFTKVATPQMLDYGYSPRFSVGVVAGSSMLGMLIPPSMLLIIYSYVSETSILDLFTAAIVPGLLLAGAMCVGIVLMAYFWKGYVGEPIVADANDETIGSSLKKVAPVVALIVFVLGGLYGGFFGPVEAGAVGAAGALIIAATRKDFTIKKFWDATLETGVVTSSLMIVVIGAVVYSKMIVLSGLPDFLSEMLQSYGFNLLAVMLAFLVLLIIAGMFLESLSIMLITVPIMLPIVLEFGGSPVWLGIVTLIGLEMGLLTPPLGLACFIVKSVIDDDRVSLKDVFLGALPFVLIMLAVVLALILFPQIALWLV